MKSKSIHALVLGYFAILVIASTINQDYRDTLHFLESLRPDIWGGHHTEYFDLEEKRKRAATEGVNAWVDPEGYRRFIATKRRAFEDEVDAEMGVMKAPSK
jgi:metallo-beta-lactamase class B